ncbi:CsaB protein [Geminocystis sp. NIES-3708]|uniref:polysaccharide pyruvyl transferase CsaB n=1 Tax=Geminocystis sp. NIES-3708 TaxID=1615909 RepID=UPI0005FCBA95|nr:polysaccharide pyruvyl transferase CsaB [Geminocystis sp. NIES-3708]BAQ62801.1 CsaB protein [Geminocystis sp. NIES-3708]
MKKAVICGYYGQGNAGDEALLVCVLETLPNNFKPIVLSGNPNKTSENYNVISYSRLNIIKEILKLGKKDLFIWGGGSLIQDVTSKKSAIFYLTLMILAQFKGLKTVAYAQGIGPIKTPFIRWLTKQVLRKCDGVSVRDKASAKLLKIWGIKYFLAADPVWALSSKIKQNLELLPNPRIAVNLRSHSSLTEEKIDIISKALIQFKKEIKANIILIPFQKSKDLEICKKVAKNLDNHCQIIMIENPQELKGLFKEVDMMIGMRLHSLIMAKSEQCKCFALSYDPKVASLMKETDIEGYELTELPSEINILTEKWLTIYKKVTNLADNKLMFLAESALQHQHLFDSVI